MATKLRAEFGERAPSRAAIYRALVRHQLIVPVPRRRTKESYTRWERTRSMELWQMDVVSRIYLTDGTQLHCITGIDDHSRFVVSAKLVPRATAKPVCDALLLALERHGVPEEILTDNGRVFTGKLQNRPTNVLFDRICLNNGIKHRLTKPYSPTTTGKVCDYVEHAAPARSDSGQGMTKVSFARSVDRHRCCASKRTGQTELT